MSDLIDRQAAIDAISCNITITGRRNAELVAETIGSFADRIKALPSAQPKRGKWNYNSKIGTFKVWTCDQCGWNYEAEFNFCPNCGARMEVTE